MSEELAWAAGFFEGEGSVRISRPTRRNWGSLIVEVSNTDRSHVEFFLTRWEGSLHEYASDGRRRGYWRWCVASRQAATFLMAIRPFVRSERANARIDHAIAFQAQKAQRGDYEYAEAQWAAYWWMAELNVRGVDAQAGSWRRS